MGKLAVGVQQKVEILKALYMNARILIMDEPTAVLTPQESDTLMQFIRDFTKQGNSVIFITHKMKEVMQAADRIVVMRAGIVVDALEKADATESLLARLMIGQDVEPEHRRRRSDWMAQSRFWNCGRSSCSQSMRLRFWIMSALQSMQARSSVSPASAATDRTSYAI